MKILLVEDDRSVATLLSNFLKIHHYTLEIAANGRIGLDLATSSDYDLIILDWQLPELDGISLCRQLRSQQCQKPILMLTVKDSLKDVVQGLDAGADDYLTKPFKMDELLARVRALLRWGETPILPDVLTWGPLRLDLTTAIVTCNGQEVSLTPKEYALLHLFLRQPQRVFSRSAILDRLWTIDTVPSEGTITNLIKDLRQKLKTAGLALDPVETVYGLGYRLREHATPATSKKERKKNENLATADHLLGHFREQFRELLPARLAVLEETEQALRLNRLSQDLRQRAMQEAHKLAGGLGIAGYPEGSLLAREIEHLLAKDAPLTATDAEQLTHSLMALNRILEQPVPEIAKPRLPQSSVQVLLVDDDLALGDCLKAEAENQGIQLDVITDLTTARHQLAQLPPPDLLLLDLLFPETSETGMDLLAELAQQFPALPVLVLTVRDSLSERLQASRLGARGFLPKPIAPTQVVEAIARVLCHTQSTTAKIMIVNDDATALTTLSDWLIASGLEVTTLQDPTQFWAVLTSTQPDLLLLDLEMPNLTGVDLCRVVRQDLRWSKLPILVATPRRDWQSEYQALSAGADAVIHKPILKPELVTQIINRLERHRLHS